MRDLTLQKGVKSVFIWKYTWAVGEGEVGDEFENEYKSPRFQGSLIKYA